MVTMYKLTVRADGHVFTVNKAGKDLKPYLADCARNGRFTSPDREWWRIERVECSDGRDVTAEVRAWFLAKAREEHETYLAQRKARFVKIGSAHGMPELDGLVLDQTGHRNLYGRHEFDLLAHKDILPMLDAPEVKHWLGVITDGNPCFGCYVQAAPLANDLVHLRVTVPTD